MRSIHLNQYDTLFKKRIQARLIFLMGLAYIYVIIYCHTLPSAPLFKSNSIISFWLFHSTFPCDTEQ